jgi:hypothetical protein
MERLGALEAGPAETAMDRPPSWQDHDYFTLAIGKYRNADNTYMIL